MHLVLREHQTVTRTELGEHYLELLDFHREVCGETFMPLELVVKEGEIAFKATNFVGVIGTPSGLTVEILPKVSFNDDLERDRDALFHMLVTTGQLPKTKESVTSGVQAAKVPLTERFILHYLSQISDLVRQGLIRDYLDVSDNLTTLRGKLVVHRQLRENLVLKHRFAVEYQEFLENRPENRLIRLALEKISRLAGQDDSKRLMQELLFALDDVPASTQVLSDLRSWNTDRNSRHYQGVFDFTRLIVLGQSPYATYGSTRFTSLLFPMQDVYERYVLELLYTTFSDWRVEAQVGREHLARLSGTKKFQLLLDVLLTQGDTRVILDTKWKVLDRREEDKWIKSSDMYQMYAYASTYLKFQSRKRVFLLYPRTPGFLTDEGPYLLEGGTEVFALGLDLGSTDPLSGLRLHLQEALA